MTEEQEANQNYELEELRREFWKAHQAAERAAHALFAALPVGPERTKAGAIFEAIRIAPTAA